MCIQFKYLTFTLLTTSISCKRTILLGTWIGTFPPRGTVVIISITWNVFKVTTALTLWSTDIGTTWSESMENLELKWRFICTHKPNSNVLTHGVFRLVCLIDQCMWYFQQTHQGYKVKREGVCLFKDDNSRNLYPRAVLWIWCHNGNNVHLDTNLGNNAFISRLLIYAWLHTFCPWNEQ